MYAEDTTAFYLNLFREEVLSHTPIKWQKKESKADICWITDSSLPPEGYRIRIHPQQMVISASDKGGFTYAVQTPTPMGSRFSRIYHLCLAQA